MFRKCLVLVTMSLALGACKSGYDSGLDDYYDRVEDADKLEKVLEASTGQAFTVEKYFTSDKDYVVMKNQTTGEYIGYNISKFNSKTMTTLDLYLAVAIPDIDIVTNMSRSDVYTTGGYWEDLYNQEWVDKYDYDSFCSCYVNNGYYQDVWAGQRWVDTSGWSSYFTKGGFTFDNSSGRSKDLELLASLDEAAAEKFVSMRLKSEFSLSSSRADELAKTVTRFHKLESVRELTASEKDIFATEAFGVSMAEYERALRDKSEGKEEAYKKLLDRAAEVNKTTPETIGDFFEEYVAD